ncbi:MAG: PucR family transcriptional regulator, partial [Propionibacteriales bacterium]|nr:PucR family transcriptional regulator [Propionibacteriales bacterium]
MAARERDISRSLLPSPRQRATIAKRFGAHAGAMTTATVAAMEQRYEWFGELSAEHRSWITLIAEDGIAGFVSWFTDPDATPPTTSELFGKAPRALARRISLQQTLDLVRTTIDVVEQSITEFAPRADRPVLQVAIWQYSRDVAFAAANVYARAAEIRGAWDTRLEALVVDAIIRGETDETVLSRASTLGWSSSSAAVVVVGPAPETEPASVVEDIRRRLAKDDIDVLGSMQGDRLIIVLGGQRLNETDHLRVVGSFVDRFGPGPVIVGPLVDHLMEAGASTRAALSGYRAAAAWPGAPRPVTSHDLLPERALAGDGHARHTLARELYDPIAAAGGGLL